MHPLHDILHRRLRHWLLALSASDERTIARALPRLRRRCLRRIAVDVARQRPSTRWGSAIDILRHRLQHDLDAIERCRRQLGPFDAGDADGVRGTRDAGPGA